MISKPSNLLTSNSIVPDGSTIVGPESFTDVKFIPSKFLDPDAKRSESQLKYAKGKGGELLAPDFQETNVRSLVTDATPALRKPADFSKERGSVGDLRTISNQGASEIFTNATLRPRETSVQLLWPKENSNKKLL